MKFKYKGRVLRNEYDTLIRASRLLRYPVNLEYQHNQ